MTLLLIIIGVNVAAWCWLAGKALSHPASDDTIESHTRSAGMSRP